MEKTLSKLYGKIYDLKMEGRYEATKVRFVLHMERDNYYFYDV
jgi:hypothetical protein